MRILLSLFAAAAASGWQPAPSAAQTANEPQTKAAPRAVKPAGQPEGQGKNTTTANPRTGMPEGKRDLYAIFRTSEGNITVRLLEKAAPETVTNFVVLATAPKECTEPRSS